MARQPAGSISPEHADMFGKQPVRFKTGSMESSAWDGPCLVFLLPSGSHHKYAPSFRSLLSYFIRLGNDAYIDPFRHARQQQPWDVQLHIGFLAWLELGNCGEMAGAEGPRERREGIESGDQGWCRPNMQAVQSANWRLRVFSWKVNWIESPVALQSFRVHPQYQINSARSGSGHLDHSQS